MNKAVVAMRRSVVLLFSFVVIASVWTVINVGVNESGNSSISSIVSAQAIGYDGAVGQPVPVPKVRGCSSGCSTKGAGGGGGGVGVSVDPDKQKSTFYSCDMVNSAGACFANNVKLQDTQLYDKSCKMSLFVNNVNIGIGGHKAVAYTKARIGSVWNGRNDVERMFSHLTGYDLGWAPYPTDFSKVNQFGYSGTISHFHIGGYKFDCYDVYTKRAPILIQMPVKCLPKNDGRPFKYSVGYYVTLKNPLAKTSKEYVTGSNHKPYRQWNWTTASKTCVYVSASTPPPMKKSVLQTCYWNIKHTGFYSTNRASIKSGGTLTSKAPISPKQNAKKPYISGKDGNSKVNNCTEVIDMSATLSLSDGYAYYRLQGNAPFQKYQYYVWDGKFTGGQEFLAKIVPASSGTVKRLVYGTHSCAFAKPWIEYSSHSALPNLNFDYSECGRGKTWQCEIYSPKINGVSNDVQVMRNGSFLNVNLGGVKVTGSGVRDYNGKAGKVTDGNLSYMVNVVHDSSPSNGTNYNSSKQYFELWKNNKKTETPWGQWVTHPNTNKNSFLTFYWSSDNNKSWSMNHKAKLNKVQFAVKFQNSNKASPTTAWKTQTNVDCDGTKTSNKATVLRSVSSEG